MAWTEKPGNPDIRRNTFPVTVQKSGGSIVTENLIIDQNIKTGNYIVYKKNLVGGEVEVIQSNKDQNDGLYKITSGPGAQLSPPGIEPKDYEKFIITSLPDIADDQRKNYFQNNGPQTAANLGIPGFRGVANPNPPTSGNGTPYLPQSPSPGSANAPDPNATTITKDTLTNIKIDSENPNPEFGDLIYPTGIRNNGQDFIKFTVIKYIPRKLDVISTGFGILGDRPVATNQKGQESQIKGNIILPIQPSISDTNNVDWNGTGFDPLGMTLTSTSLNIASGAMTQQDLDALFAQGGKTLSDPNFQKAIRLYLAQKAGGVEGLLSRVAGAVVNPNLELLFQGPTLRPFNFTFRLSPRDNDEATKVRKIIRVFKQYSAVGTTSGGLFLTTPNVFDIQYVSKNDKENPHQSLNRIKTCALKSVSVDYTPDGSYMTFNDEAKTMTSYSLSLQFQELEPVTTKDYIDNKIPYDHIGY